VGLFSNKWSVGAFFTGIILLTIVLFVPFMRKLFVVVPLAGNQLLAILLLAAVPTILIQLIKIIKESSNKVHTK